MQIDRRRALTKAAALPLAALLPTLPSCSGSGSAAPSPPAPQPPAPLTRTWSMGFSGNPVRPDAATLLRGVDLWAQRAEYAAVHEDVPWADLLAGMTPDAILDRDKVQLVQYYRGKGLKLYFLGDMTDGLDRSADASALRKLNRSLTEPAVQQVYRNYMLAVMRKLQPEIIGLAAETNLVRAAAPAALYAAIVTTANAAAADLRAAGATATLLSSVQVEVAWGWNSANKQFVGIDTDVRDFPFTQMLGFSSYPYFLYAQPEDLPADYYSRVLAGRTLPPMVVEGGWASAAAGTIASNPDKQARYIARHAQLLDSVKARGILQLVFADLDLSSFPPPLPANLPLFGSIGLMDSSFVAKPALAVWDGLFARPRRAP